MNRVRQAQDALLSLALSAHATGDRVVYRPHPDVEVIEKHHDVPRASFDKYEDRNHYHPASRSSEYEVRHQGKVVSTARTLEDAHQDAHIAAAAHEGYSYPHNQHYNFKGIHDPHARVQHALKESQKHDPEPQLD